jgi:hypothetical protein
MKDGNKLIKTTIAFFILLLIVFFALPKNRRFLRGPLCSEKAAMEEIKLDAIVISKFNDSNNHNYQTVKFQDIKNGTRFNVFFINEKSGFFDLVETGDTVIKKTKCLDILSNNKRIESRLVYDCPDE